MTKHSTPRRRSGKHWVGTLLTAGAVVACMGLLLRFLPVGTIPTGGDEPSDSAVSSTEPAASSVPEPEEDMVTSCGVAARALNALAMAGIEVLLITTSDLDISLLVHAENEDAAYETLKKAYEL